MMKQKLIAQLVTGIVTITGISASLETFNEKKIEEIKTNYEIVETILKNNEEDLVNAYNKLYEQAISSINNLNKENSNLNKKNDDLNKEIENINNLCSTESYNLKNEINTLKNEINRLENELDKKEECINELKNN